MASVEDTTEVVCSRGVRLVADTLISQLPSPSDSHYDAIALPVWARGRLHTHDACAVTNDVPTYPSVATVWTFVDELSAPYVGRHAWR